MIFCHLQAKLQQLLRTAQATNICFGSRSNENARFFAFAILGCCKYSKKKTFTQADRNSFTSMVAIIAVNALKIQKQMRLKLAKN